MIIKHYEEEHGKGVIDILNYYIVNTNTTFLPSPIPQEKSGVIKRLLGEVLFLVAVEQDEVIGFICFRHYSSPQLFSECSEMGIYIKNGFTKKGIGSALLKSAIPLLKIKNKKHIVTIISSLNENSKAFHKAKGFCECGEYDNICKKDDKIYGVSFFKRDI